MIYNIRNQLNSLYIYKIKWGKYMFLGFPVGYAKHRGIIYNLFLNSR